MAYGQVHVSNTMDAQIVHSALEDYLAKLDHDLRTKYDGDPRFCKEDTEFLKDASDRVRLLLHGLQRSHPTIIVKG
jgi:hypothetical protein